MKLFLIGCLFFLTTVIGTTTAQALLLVDGLDEALKRCVSVLAGTFISVNTSSRASKMVASYQKVDNLHKPGTISLIFQEFNRSEELTVSYIQFSTEGSQFVMRPALIRPDWRKRYPGLLNHAMVSTLTHNDLIEGDSCARRINYAKSPPYYGEWPPYPKCFANPALPGLKFEFDCKRCATTMPHIGTFIFSKTKKNTSPIPSWRPLKDPCP